MRVLIATLPAMGHVNPMREIAAELVRRGHEVRWYTGEAFRAQVEASGAGLVPIRTQTQPPGDLTLPRVRLPRLDGLVQTAWYAALLLEMGADQARELLAALRSFPADVLLADALCLGAAFVRELGGPPLAVCNVVPLDPPGRDRAPFGLGLSPARSAPGRLRNRVLRLLIDRSVNRGLDARAARVRAGLGLPPRSVAESFETTQFSQLYLQASGESFEYDFAELPPCVHFVGPLLPGATAGFIAPGWWHELSSPRPVVLVSQGTLATDLQQLVVPALRALADEDALVVAITCGRSLQQAGLSALPDNARAEPFVPYAELMPHVDAMLTNGSYGGVQFALSHGVPIVAAGRSEDKVETAARVAHAGAGIDLRTEHPGLRKLRRAVQRVLRDPRHRAAAQRIRDDFARHDAPRESADLLERLAATKSPVPRPAGRGEEGP